MADQGKSDKTKKKPPQAEQAVYEEEQPKKIMTQPLPQILDEIENSIQSADEAAKNAREAAEEARKAGEKAANEASRVAAEAIAKVEETAKKAMQLAELLNLAIMDGVTAVDKRLSGKATAIESAEKIKK